MISVSYKSVVPIPGLINTYLDYSKKFLPTGNITKDTKEQVKVVNTDVHLEEEAPSEGVS